MKIALLGLLFVFLFAFVPHAFAFSNGQAASLVIGHSTFTAYLPTGLTSTTGYGPFANASALSFFTGASTSVAFDSSGNLWVTDTLNNRVLEFAYPFSNGMSASLVIGQPNFAEETPASSYVPDVGSGAATASGLYVPEGVALDSFGNLWVADTENNRVLEYTPPFSNGMSASLVIGQTSLTTDTFGSTANTLVTPTSIAFDSSGNLWVADMGNNRVLKYLKGTGDPGFKTGMSASLVIGQPAVSGYGLYPTAKNVLSSPWGIAFDSSGNLWVADTYNNRVLEFAYPFSTDMDASLVIGQTSFTTDTATGPTASGLDHPLSVAFDSSGNLWVTDTLNNRVLEFAYPFSNGMSASLVIGQTSFYTNITPPTASGMYQPSALAFDSFGNLWVADTRYNRVLEYAGPLTTTTTTSSSTGTVAPSTSVTDTAAVAAVPSTAGTPTGSVQFYFCGPTATATSCAISPGNLCRVTSDPVSRFSYPSSRIAYGGWLLLLVSCLYP